MRDRSHEGEQLPSSLIEKVPVELRKALQHPIRRQILRVLSRDVQKLSPAEIAESGLVPCPLSRTAYHMLVLQEGGLVKPAGSVPAEDMTVHYASTRAEDGSIVSRVLRDTAQSDERHLMHAGS